MLVRKTVLLACLALLISLGTVGAQQDRLITIAFEGGAVTMDPHKRQETTTLAWQQHVYEYLIRLSREGELVPELATSWEAEGENTWVITLREGVSWHDGSPFTAEDVVGSLTRAKTHPESQMAQYLTAMREAVATDANTVEIHTDTPDPLLPLKLAQVLVAKPDYAEEVGDDRMANEPMGTGPYRAVSYTTDDSLTLEAFEDYWGEQPEFRRVRLVNIPAGATRLSALLTGDVDIAEKILPQDFERVERSPDAYITMAPSTRVIYLTMNFACRENCPASGLPGGVNPFVDPTVRQAVAHAINVDAIIERVMGGVVTPATQYISPIDYLYDPLVERFDYDPERARELLAEAGYENGFRMRLDAPNDRYLNDALVAQAIGGMLGAVGIEVEVNATTRTVFFPLIDEGEFMMYLAGWGSPDVVSTFNNMIHTRDPEAGFGRLNRYFYANPEMDALITEVNAEFNEARRIELIHEINRHTLTEDVVWIPLYVESVIAGVRSDIDFEANPQEYILAFELQSR